MIKNVSMAAGSVLLVGLLFASAPRQKNSARSGVPIGSQTHRAQEVIKDDEHDFSFRKIACPSEAFGEYR
jgi:hypothetical protein